MARGIGTSLGAVYFPTMHYTNTIEGKLAVGALSGKKNPKIGWVEKAFIPVTFHDYVVGNLPGATFVDVTEEVDRLRGIKSPEEIELHQGLRRAAGRLRRASAPDDQAGHEGLRSLRRGPLLLQQERQLSGYRAGGFGAAGHHGSFRDSTGCRTT